MTSRNAGLIVERLFVGPTRPAMWALVPLSALVIEVIFIAEIFLWTRNLLSLVWIIPIHGILYLLCLNEPRIFELFKLWAMTKGLNWFAARVYWKASSYSPLPIRVGRPDRYIRERFE